MADIGLPAAPRRENEAYHNWTTIKKNTVIP